MGTNIKSRQSLESQQHPGNSQTPVSTLKIMGAIARCILSAPCSFRKSTYFQGSLGSPHLLKVTEFPGGSEVKASACNAGDLGSTPGLGRSPGEGNGNPLQYSCLENPMDRGAWRATVHGVAKSQTQLSNFTFTSLGNPHLLKVTEQYCCLKTEKLHRKRLLPHPTHLQQPIPKSPFFPRVDPQGTNGSEKKAILIVLSQGFLFLQPGNLCPHVPVSPEL